MKLYFSPLACSLASRIACYEAGAEASFIEIDPPTKKTLDGLDYRSVSALGLVPALVTDAGDTILENAAILQHIAELYPARRLIPLEPLARTRMRQWLSFIGTELHKALYVPLLDRKAPDAVKAYALSKAESRLGWVAQNLEGRDYLLGEFSVADAYLFAVLNWSSVTPVDLSPWPVIKAYQARLHARPEVARAFAHERELYSRELARHRVVAPPSAAPLP
jgi:glutathione S-transferase